MFQIWIKDSLFDAKLAKNLSKIVKENMSLIHDLINENAEAISVEQLWLGFMSIKKNECTKYLNTT